MKTILHQSKFLLSFIFFLSATGYAQNLVQNGDLELWDNQNQPTDWDLAENISQENVQVYQGTYSAKHTSADNTQKLRQDITGIEEGKRYTIKYYYYDNDPEARTRIYSYWMNGTEYLDAHAAELRPGTYSSDQDDWIEYSQTLVAPPTANAFRFDVRVYKQDGIYGGFVYYDNFSIEEAEVLHEPTNYPTGFAAIANNLSIDLSWTDAIGEQEPTAYLILAKDNDQIEPPIDGTDIEDDGDLSDGSGALNILFGEEMCSFGDLEPGETYYFEIYPYTNGGSDIDYKNDGTVPTAEATISDLIILNYENFNDTTFGEWTQYSVVGPEQFWYIQDKYGVDNSPNAKMTGYDGGAVENEDWLISPVMSGDGVSNEKLEFFNATKHDGPELEVKISTDYDGVSDPNTATWIDLTAELSPGNWEWVHSGIIEISSFTGTTDFYVAFKYESTSSEASTWEIDEILITADPGVGIQKYQDHQYAVYPNPASDFISIENDGSIELLKVFSLKGKLVLENVPDENNQVYVGNLNTGIYIVSLINNQGKLVGIEKLIRK